ncbi:MAG: hypothetical protein HPY85_05085 [Anaerolineae bacterium]|nr:hypothetical protein [Anaerolineae bacterium]
MSEKLLKRVSAWIDTLSNFFAARKGLLPLAGILLVVVNFFLSLFLTGFWAESNLLLHLGVIISLLGIMLAWAL